METHNADSGVAQRPAATGLRPAPTAVVSDHYNAWLRDLCKLVPGAQGAIVVAPGAHGGFQPVALWPVKLQASPEVVELVDGVIAERAPLVAALDDDSYAVAYPVLDGDELALVTALLVRVNDERELQQAMRLLQWGSQGLFAEQLQQQLTSGSHHNRQLAQTLTFYSKLLGEQSFDDAGLRLVTELAVIYGCDLVSLGIVEKERVKICHLSSSAQFGKQMNLVRHLEAAMNEAVDQHQTVLLPLPEDDPERHRDRQQVIVLAHRALAEAHKDEAILTLPLIVDDRCYGAVTLQRPLQRPFSNAEADACESLLGLAAACLEDKREQSKPLYRKIADSAAAQLHKLVGQGHAAYKLTAIAVVVLLAFALLAQGEYRLSTDARLKSAEQRAIVAPYDGYIDQAPVRAGDLVKADELLLALDEKDMVLEQLRWLSQKNKLQRQYQEASAEYDRAKVNIINAQLQQAEAQLKLVESRLARARQLAPFDGLVVTGDLTQRLGGAVKQGELLYELAPENDYKVELLVKESRILDVAVGQRGVLFLSALPEQGFAIEVSRLTPTTESSDGATYYLIEARLEQPSPALRPGMEGVGKIVIDRRNLVGIWSRDLREWWLLKQWAWWG